ncbi:adenosylcobinamide-phosphate synthase CbiB [Halovivax gelatinilyticus]|uniref:adenosylcobinamide-phosphate synthase CbiB n=1 Tax=Halovivax gelatinilyticus TaxID=2961597 RepID=UPI0020CA4D8F|nr:adenosylcobinamide-phosphate synthase CbiB [Halovivax gelatinilyticus]
MTLTTLALVAFAFGLDLLVGDPPNRLHPVAWFGAAVAPVDRDWSVSERAERLLGIVVAVAFPGVVAIVVAGIVHVAAEIHYLVPAILAGTVLFVTTSLRSLLELTETVVERSVSDVEAARAVVPGLVGREPNDLSPGQLRSAAVESATENLSDGFVATFLPFVLVAPFSLSAAAGVAAWVKAVNTLDSMLGYPEKPIGTASARLDDLVMIVPARLTALSLAIAAGRPDALVRARTWARATPSPNAGWPMAVGAVVLGVRLEKPGVYVLNPDAENPTVEDGRRALTLVGLGAAVAVTLTVAATIVAQLVHAEVIV